MFADGTRLALRPDTRRGRVWRQKRCAGKYRRVQEVHTFGCDNVMFWAGIMLGLCVLLIPIAKKLISQRYVDEVLQPLF